MYMDIDLSQTPKDTTKEQIEELDKFYKEYVDQVNALQTEFLKKVDMLKKSDDKKDEEYSTNTEKGTTE